MKHHWDFYNRKYCSAVSVTMIPLCLQSAKLFKFSPTNLKYSLPSTSGYLLSVEIEHFYKAQSDVLTCIFCSTSCQNSEFVDIEESSFSWGLTDGLYCQEYCANQTQHWRKVLQNWNLYHFLYCAKTPRDNEVTKAVCVRLSWQTDLIYWLYRRQTFVECLFY